MKHLNPSHTRRHKNANGGESTIETNTDRSYIGRSKPCRDGSCYRCRKDKAFLKRKRRPAPANTGRSVRAVDLFAGCGGMSVGLEEAARRARRFLEIPLAMDDDEDVLKVYQMNFPEAITRVGDIASLFEGDLGASRTSEEYKISKELGRIDVLLGGPPCQGHSDLNNLTRHIDPKNALYLRMARAAEILAPKVVVVENVVPVQRDRSDVVGVTKDALERAGYQVAGRVIDLRRVGVPQCRHRFLLVASKVDEIKPMSVLKRLATGIKDHQDRTVRWAIEDLIDVDSSAVYDTASRPSTENAKRMAYLFARGGYDLPNVRRPRCHQNERHTYRSMYGRLDWDRPAQTLTTGFGSMGQGRYVHPGRQRTITPHEAARLQTFPDWFRFGDGPHRRTVLSKMIGNAVPPLLMVALGTAIIQGLEAVEAPRRRTA